MRTTIDCESDSKWVLLRSIEWNYVHSKEWIMMSVTGSGDLYLRHLIAKVMVDVFERENGAVID